MVCIINPFRDSNRDQFVQIMKQNGFTNTVATYSGVLQNLHDRTTSSGKRKTESLMTGSTPRYPQILPTLMKYHMWNSKSYLFSPFL
jgi:hypothetical protein